MSNLEPLVACEICGMIASEQVFAADGRLHYYCLTHLPPDVYPATHADRAALTEALARVEAAKVAEWVAAGPCPLCAAQHTRSSYDEANNVRVSYCLHCKAAILWTKEVQP